MKFEGQCTESLDGGPPNYTRPKITPCNERQPILGGGGRKPEPGAPPLALLTSPLSLVREKIKIAEHAQWQRIAQEMRHNGESAVLCPLSHIAQMIM